MKELWLVSLEVIDHIRADAYTLASLVDLMLSLWFKIPLILSFHIVKEK